MLKVLLVVIGVTAGLTGCSSLMSPGKGTPPAGLTSGQRQTDQNAFGHASATEARSGLPAGAPEVALFEAGAQGSRGVVVAAWSDGTIVFAPRAGAPGSDLRIGRTESARVASVVEGCVSNGLGTGKTTGAAAEAPYRAIGMRARGAQAISRAWSLADRSNEALEARAVCGPCAEQVAGLIPMDGGRVLAQNRAWLDSIDRFAHTGVWSEAK